MIAIVTDSTAYLTHEEAARMGVVVVPMTYTVEGGHAYSEGLIEDSDACERLVAENIGKMHTSQASLSAFHRAFSRLRHAGYEVLCITISSRLSGTFANALLAAKELGGDKIEVVDSLSTCGGFYLLVREAHEMIGAGADIKEVARRLEHLRHKLRTAFSVDDMEPLRRSGRLGNVKLSISTILNIKPILRVVDGGIVSVGVARGRIDQIKRLCAYAKDAPGQVLVERFLAGDDARALEAQLNKDNHETLPRRVGPVLGAHLGSGLMGVSWLDVPPR